MTFRKIGILLLTLLLSLTAAAQEGYFNTVPGSTLKWVIRDGSGKLFGSCYETLVSLEGNQGNGKICYSYRFLDAEGKSVIGNKPFVFNVTLSEGGTRAYVDNASKALKAGDYMPVGDLSTVPADINVGDRLEDSRITVKILSVFTATNTYSNRRVTARETVTVPAGTFDCLLIEDDETFTGAGPFHIMTWVARGVGIVRQIIYKKDGTVNQVFELALND